MSKLLEKTLKDALKEDSCTLGTKQTLGSLGDSKLIIVSQSVLQKHSQKIQDAKIPTIQFRGSSVALGRLCGLQFRVGALSLSSITDANIKSIINENESQK